MIACLASELLTLTEMPCPLHPSSRLGSSPPASGGASNLPNPTLVDSPQTSRIPSPLLPYPNPHPGSARRPRPHMNPTCVISATTDHLPFFSPSTPSTALDETEDAGTSASAKTHAKKILCPPGDYASISAESSLAPRREAQREWNRRFTRMLHRHNQPSASEQDFFVSALRFSRHGTK